MPNWRDDYELEDDGRLRKKRVLPDGERISFPMTMMDHANYGFTRRFSDGTPDFSDPHKPGFRVLDTDDTSRVAAHDAYEAMRTRLDYRTRRQHQDDAADCMQDKAPRARIEAYARFSGAQVHDSPPPRKNESSLVPRAGSGTLDPDRARELADAAYAERSTRMSQAWRNRQS